MMGYYYSNDNFFCCGATFCTCSNCYTGGRTTSALMDRALQAIHKLTEEIRATVVIWPGLPGAPLWFDRYRLPVNIQVVKQIVRRIQERFPITQRRARKRRRLIQQLA